MNKEETIQRLRQLLKETGKYYTCNTEQRTVDGISTLSYEFVDEEGNPAPDVEE